MERKSASLDHARPHKEGSIRNLYLRKVLANLLLIERMLTRLPLKFTNDTRTYLLKILNSAQSVIDLAAVHGFDGIERIADKLCSVLHYLLTAKVELSPSMCEKIKIAVCTMRQVAEMEAALERQMTVERTERQIRIGQQKVQNCAEQVSDSLDVLFKKQLELDLGSDGQINPPLQFDIRESPAVLKLVEKSEHTVSGPTITKHHQPD